MPGPEDFIGSTLEQPITKAPAVDPEKFIGSSIDLPESALSPSEEGATVGNVLGKPLARGAVKAVMTGADLLKAGRDLNASIARGFPMTLGMLPPFWAAKHMPEMGSSGDMIHELGLEGRAPGMYGYPASAVEGGVSALGALPAAGLSPFIGPATLAVSGAVSGVTGEGASHFGGEGWRPWGELAGSLTPTSLLNWKNWRDPLSAARRLLGGEDEALATTKGPTSKDLEKADPAALLSEAESRIERPAVPRSEANAALGKELASLEGRMKAAGNEAYEAPKQLIAARNKLFPAGRIWQGMNRGVENARLEEQLDRLPESDYKAIAGTLYGKDLSNVPIEEISRLQPPTNKLTYFQLRGLEQRVGDAYHRASIEGNGASAKALSEMHKEIRGVMDDAVNGKLTGVPVTIKDSLANARNLWSEYRGMFGGGEGGLTALGEAAKTPEIAGKTVMKAGDEGALYAQRLKAAVDKSPMLSDHLQQFALNDLMGAAEKNGTIDPSKVQAWMKRYEPFLNQFSELQAKAAQWELSGRIQRAAAGKLTVEDLDRLAPALKDPNSKLALQRNYAEGLLGKLVSSAGSPKDFAKIVKAEAPIMTRILDRGPDSPLPGLLAQAMKDGTFTKEPGMAHQALARIRESVPVGNIPGLRILAYTPAMTGESAGAHTKKVLRAVANAVTYPDQMQELVKAAGGNRQRAYQTLAYSLATAGRAAQDAQQ